MRPTEHLRYLSIVCLGSLLEKVLFAVFDTRSAICLRHEFQLQLRFRDRHRHQSL